MRILSTGLLLSACGATACVLPDDDAPERGEPDPEQPSMYGARGWRVYQGGANATDGTGVAYALGMSP